ncbi:hypothetical protein U1Q18_038935, partial [Sarracenia purpurea var. burkii]
KWAATGWTAGDGIGAAGAEAAGTGAACFWACAGEIGAVAADTGAAETEAAG